MGYSYPVRFAPIKHHNTVVTRVEINGDIPTNQKVGDKAVASVSFKNVIKRYSNGFQAVTDLNLDIEDKEFVVLVGPSGCGKSTTLRMLAGLEEISEGELWIGDRVVNDVPPKDRDIAMVFQSYALYPHMTVYDNMAFGLKLRKTPKDEIDRRVRRAAKMLELEEHELERKPKALSGGQRQRVAVGRAIVRKPQVFLMDEPLSNLDAKLRVSARATISKLHRDLETTFVYVTHDQVEAMTMGDRIAVLNRGFLMQCDSPRKLYSEPNNMFVAGFIGSPSMNFYDATLVQEEGNLFADTGNFRIHVPADRTKMYKSYVGKQVVLGIRPEHIHHKDFAPPGVDPAYITGSVDVVELLGAELHLYVTSGTANYVATIDTRANPQVGDSIEMVFDVSQMHLFDKDSEQVIR